MRIEPTRRAGLAVTTPIEGLLIGGLLSERMWLPHPSLWRQEFQMATMSPLRRRMIEDMTIRKCRALSDLWPTAQ